MERTVSTSPSIAARTKPTSISSPTLLEVIRCATCTLSAPRNCIVPSSATGAPATLVTTSPGSSTPFTDPPAFVMRIPSAPRNPSERLSALFCAVCHEMPSAQRPGHLSFSSASRRNLCGNHLWSVLNRRVVLHAIDATPARWRGDAGSSPFDRARTATSSPRNDFVHRHTG